MVDKGPRLSHTKKGEEGLYMCMQPINRLKKAEARMDMLPIKQNGALKFMCYICLGNHERRKTVAGTRSPMVPLR